MVKLLWTIALLALTTHAQDALDSADCPDPGFGGGEVTSFCNSYLNYQTPAPVTKTATVVKTATTTKSFTTAVTVVDYTTLTSTFVSTTTVTVNARRRRQTLGGAGPDAAVSSFCSCIGVTSPATPTVTSTKTVTSLISKSATVTGTVYVDSTVWVTKSVVATKTTTSIGRITTTIPITIPSSTSQAASTPPSLSVTARRG